MKKGKMIYLLCLGFLLVALFTGCGSKTTSAGTDTDKTKEVSEGENQKQYRVAFVTKNLTNPAWINISEGIKSVCDANGIEYVVTAPDKETDVEQQVQICQTYLSQEFDAIFVAPVSSTGIVPFIKECNDAGVLFVNMDTAADENTLESLGAKVDVFVGTDDTELGKLQAEAMVNVLDGKGKIMILEGTAGAENSKRILDGIHQVLADAPDIEVVASQAADFNRNLGYTTTQTLLSANPDISGIIGCNDEMALGAVKALQEVDMLEQVKVLGANFVPDAETAIRDGSLYGTVNKGHFNQGVLAATEVLKYLNGEEYQEQVIAPLNFLTIEDLENNE